MHGYQCQRMIPFSCHLGVNAPSLCVLGGGGALKTLYACTIYAQVVRACLWHNRWGMHGPCSRCLLGRCQDAHGPCCSTCLQKHLGRRGHASPGLTYVAYMQAFYAAAKVLRDQVCEHMHALVYRRQRLGRSNFRPHGAVPASQVCDQVGAQVQKA